MPEYRVTWEIDIEAANPRAAALKALEIQRRVGSSAVVFDVFGENGHWKEDLDSKENSYKID